MINIAEILKDCPQGMELDCTMYDNLYFDSVNADYYGTINCYTLIDGIKTSICFTKYGTFNKHVGAKCVIFPKGKTTWKGFVPPCKFKDGDIITDSLGTCIFKGEGEFEGTVNYYCGISNDYFRIKDDKCNPSGHYGYIVNYRLSTEEEKQKLFDAIKANGYKWNAETKTLEKLIVPKFKVGDKIVKKDNPTECWYVQGVDTNCNLDYFYYIVTKGQVSNLHFKDQDNWELAPKKFDITTLKPFDKVLVRCNSLEKWHIQFFEKYNTELGAKYPFICLCTSKYCQCIPYEGNEHLLGTTDDCDDFYKNW